MLKKPRGTVDIYGQYGDIFFAFLKLLDNISINFGYSRVETPIFEEKKLFLRTKDDTSDMINKEMYNFFDKSNRELVLRPEGTAPVVRFILEEKILDKEKPPLKYYYIGPMFRYERPQNGRQRQFYQYGIECISIDNIYDEIDVILLANEIIDKLGIEDSILKINYIGNKQTRLNWINELKKYFKDNSKNLSEDSIKRIDKNPLRILDDKIDGNKKVVLLAPKIDSFLTLDEKKYIENFKNILNENNIKFEWDKNLVRGLDYYTGIVFEIISTNENHTIIGGGKYEKIFSEIGNTDYSCFGFAIGIERTLKIINNNKLENFLPKNNIYFANLCDEFLYANKIINNLRRKEFSIVTSYSTKKLKNHFKLSEKYNPRIILIFGEKENNKNEIIIKDQFNKNEKKVNLSKIENELKKIIGV